MPAASSELPAKHRKRCITLVIVEASRPESPGGLFCTFEHGPGLGGRLAYGDEGVGEAAGPADDGGCAAAHVYAGVGLLDGPGDKLVVVHVEMLAVEGH